MGNDEILEFAIGLQKDPSWDRLLATMPEDVKSKLSGAGKGAFDNWETQGKAMFKKLGTFAAGALGLGGAAGLAMRINEVAEIEEKTARLSRTAGLTAKEEQALADAVMRTSQEYGANRSEALDALQAIQDKYAVVNKLAKEGSLDETLKNAQLVSDAYGMSLDTTMKFMGALSTTGNIQSKQMLDTMAWLEQAANMGSIGFGEMGDVFPELLAEAASFGEGGVNNVMDVAAALETLTKKIQDPARATTYLRGTLAKLKDDDVGKRMMEELGVSTKDANDEFRDLSNIIEDMQKSMEGRSGGEQAAILKKIFGSEEAVSTIDELIRSGGTFKAILDLQIGESTEGFVDFLQKANKDTASNMDKLKSKFTGLVDEVLLTDEAMGGLSASMEYLGVAMEGAIKGLSAGSASQAEAAGMFVELLFDIQEGFENIFNWTNMKLGGDKDFFSFDAITSPSHRRGGVDLEPISTRDKMEFFVRMAGGGMAMELYDDATGKNEPASPQGFRGRQSARDEQEREKWITFTQDMIQGIKEAAKEGTAEGAEKGAEKGTKKAKITVVGPSGGPPAENTVLGPK
jgi:TP901 family phage tail tape measure protein